MTHSVVENLCDWVQLIKSEYAEMPGLHLSKRQAQRMWNLDAPSTDLIFAALEAANVVKKLPNDVYVRANIGY